MPLKDCFGCTRHRELLSLRRQVEKLQSEDVTLIRLKNAKDKISILNEQNHKLTEDCAALRTDNRELSRKIRYIENKCKESIKSTEKRYQSEIERLTKEKNQEIRELQDKIQKLESQLHKNSQNSSKPSSQDMNRPKIQNNREKTNRKPGGQPGHKGHHLHKSLPTKKVFLETPKEIAENKKYYKTGKRIIKQLVKVSFRVEIIQYEADEYKEKATGKRVSAAFPQGMINEVTYDASVKALAALLHSHGNMSYGKVKEVMSELSEGKLNISTGTLAVLEKEFSNKTKGEREKIRKELLGYEYAHVDGTTARVNGKQENVMIMTSPKGTLLYQKKHKGVEGVKDTVIEEYKQTLVHDGEATFYKYGSRHQGCLIHEMRYLKGSMENEPTLTWAKEMRKLLQEAIHLVNEAKRKEKSAIEKKKAERIRRRYDEILEKAEKEYEKNPPNKKYYIEGYNTMKRLKKNKASYLLFLDHIEIPPTNNAAELVARKVKMHSKQSGGYRNREYGQYYCDTLSVIESNRVKGIGRYKTLLMGFSHQLKKAPVD